MSEGAGRTDIGDAADAVASIGQLQQFNGPPREFWPALMRTLGAITGAHYGVLVSRGPDGRLASRLAWPPERAGDPEVRPFSQWLSDLARTALASGPVCQPLPGGHAIGIRFHDTAGGDPSVALFLVCGLSDEAAAERLTRLSLTAGVPAAYATAALARRDAGETEPFTRALELATLLNSETRFMAAALTVCNELAGGFGCTRASLGMLDGRYYRLQAMSNTEKFEPKMEAVQQLEKVMEECADQDTEVVLPGGEDRGTVTRDHEAFIRLQGGHAICSLPLRFQARVVGVVVCEREMPFSERDLRMLRLCCDQAAPRLWQLRDADRWIGARAMGLLRERAARLVGVEHTGAKLAALAAVVCLLVLAVGRMDYRVEGNFELRSRNVAYVAAPFDGFIRTVQVELDDTVTQGQPLLNLDTAELTLQQSAAAADANRYNREMEKARADGELAAMRIAVAKLAQTRAQLELISHRLSLAEVKAPIAGVIVEGEQRERLGSPVDKGEILFRIAQLSDYYIEVEVPQTEIHELTDGVAGEIAFSSQPELKFPFQVTRVEPIARTSSDGSVFIVRAKPAGEFPAWWRPGMTGVAKLEVGRRSILWVFTHETIDFLRMYLWL